MAFLIDCGITLHSRMSLRLLVARVALAPSRRIPTYRTCHTYLTCLTYRTELCRTYLTCRTCRTYLTYLAYLMYFNKIAPHWRVRRSTVLAVHPMAMACSRLRSASSAPLLQMRRSTACPHGDPSSELRSQRQTTAN